MRFLGFEITRLKGTSLGGMKAIEWHIINIEGRLDRLEHHRKAVAVKTEKELSDEEEIQKILTGGVQTPSIDYVELYHRR